MKTVIKIIRFIILALSIITTVLLDGCTPFSESITDKSAGMNGSFEHTKNGLPVNWLLYTPKTVGTGDFDIIIDTTEFKDGKQSLKFLVRKCSAVGSWHSPGLDQEYDANPGETYNVSFWVKNIGSEFIVHISGVSAFKGQDGPVERSKDTITTWRLFEYKYTIPPKMERLRFEMNILHPGSFWIDDIRIEKINDNK
jgi:hypothetical protein